MSSVDDWAGTNPVKENRSGLIGKPVDGGLNFQPAATELAVDIHWLDTMLNYVITAIVLFVLGLMIYSFIRFNRRAAHSTSTHSG